MDVYRLPGEYADDLALESQEKASAAAEGRTPRTLSELVAERYDEAIAKAEAEVAALHAAKDSYLAYLDSKVVANAPVVDTPVNDSPAVNPGDGSPPVEVEATPIADAVAADVANPVTTEAVPPAAE